MAYRRCVSTEAPFRYRSADEDSGRWVGFAYRDGDVVISTRSKSGTTWVQMICALLVFQSVDFPAPLSELSPWLDWLVTPRAEVYERLAAQRHRRFIKTHTPLDGIPLDGRATYIVVARHPLDMAVSLYHQVDNLDRERLRQLTGQHPRARLPAQRPPLSEWLVSWVERDADPRENLDSLPGVLWHLSDAWRRREQPNVVLVHFDDLLTNLEAEIRRLAERLAVTVAEERWPELVEAATFDWMRAHAERLVPDPVGVLRDASRFFRRGVSGSATEVLSSAQVTRYKSRAAALASPDLLA
jgi:aryl sulfotransferase